MLLCNSDNRQLTVTTFTRKEDGNKLLDKFQSLAMSFEPGDVHVYAHKTRLTAGLRHRESTHAWFDKMEDNDSTTCTHAFSNCW